MGFSGWFSVCFLTSSRRDTCSPRSRPGPPPWPLVDSACLSVGPASPGHSTQAEHGWPVLHVVSLTRPAALRVQPRVHSLRWSSVCAHRATVFGRLEMRHLTLHASLSGHHEECCGVTWARASVWTPVSISLGNRCLSEAVGRPRVCPQTQCCLVLLPAACAGAASPRLVTLAPHHSCARAALCVSPRS